MHSLFKALEIVADAVIPTMPRVLRNALTLGCVLIAASAVAGTLLWIPYTRRRISDGAARREKRMQQQTDEAAFDAMFWDEYDAMMVATTTATGSGAENADMDLDPVTVSTPQGDVSMTYVPGRGAFGYYTDRRGSVAYPHLETVARKFLLHHTRPDLARLAYADRRLKGVANEHVSAAAAAEAAAAAAVDAIQVAPVAPVPTPSQSIFARLRSYNRKLGDDSSAAQAAQAAAIAAPPPPPEYTRFVWLGTLYDLAEASKSSPDYERVDYDYAEFKRLNPARSSASSPPELEPEPAASAASSDSDE
jgi:hypothetical protein